MDPRLCVECFVGDLRRLNRGQRALFRNVQLLVHLVTSTFINRTKLPGFEMLDISEHQNFLTFGYFDIHKPDKIVWFRNVGHFQTPKFPYFWLL